MIVKDFVNNENLIPFSKEELSKIQYPQRIDTTIQLINKNSVTIQLGKPVSLGNYFLAPTNSVKI